MEFKYTITAELTSIERMTLALRGEPYYFLRADDGTVKINPDLPAEVLSIGGEMWRIDHLMEEEDKKIIKTILQQLYGSIGQYEVLSAMKPKETDKGFDIVRSLCRSHRSTAFACVCGEDGLSFIWHGFD